MNEDDDCQCPSCDEAERVRSWQMMLDHVGTYEPKPLDTMGRPKMARPPTKRNPDHAFNKFDL